MNFDINEHTILQVLVGSRGYGLHTAASDYDFKGVAVEPMASVVGFSTFEQHQTKVGDVSETVIYGLRKFLKLALKGNPTMLEVLFSRNYITQTFHGAMLQELAPKIISRKCAGNAYLSYMQAQRKKLLSGYGAEGIRRECVERFGYDTKFAMHALRLGMQGLELMTTCCLALPVADADRDFLLNVRMGKFELDEIIERLWNLENLLRHAMDNSFVQEEPDYAAVEAWMLQVYRATWEKDANPVDA